MNRKGRETERLKRVRLIGGHFDGKLDIVGPGIDRISEFRFEPSVLNIEAVREETYLPMPIDGPDFGLIYFRHVTLAEDNARMMINGLETSSLSDFDRFNKIGAWRTLIDCPALSGAPSLLKHSAP